MSVLRNSTPLAAFSCFTVLLCGSSLLVVPSTARAETWTLEPVTVTATRYERPLATTPMSVTVLEPDDLAPYAALPLEDILSTLGGVTVARSGGPGQQTSIFLRGTDSDSVLVLVDGVKINGATFGGANLQNLRGANLARVEIVRGPRSTLYGSEAIGGVISITTRRASATTGSADIVDRVSLSGEGGSDDTAQIGIAAARDHGEHHLAASINDFRTDGDPIIDSSAVQGEHRNTSGTLNGSSLFGNTRIGIDATTARGTTQYLDAFALTALRQDFENTTASLWSETAFSDDATLRARLGHAGDQIDQQDSVDFAHTSRLIANIDWQQHLGDHMLIAGVAGEEERADALIYGTPTEETTRNKALFLRDEWTHGPHSIALGGRTTDYDNFGKKNTGEASYGLQYAERGYTWLAWGRGFRAPDAIERFGYGGNPDLQPESSESAEIGIRQRIGQHELTVTGFRQDIDQLIVCMALPPPSWDCQLQNIDQARITGTELGWSWRQDGTRVEALATLLDAENADTGERLSRRPDQQLSATARQRLDAIGLEQLEVRAAVLAMDSRDNSGYDDVQLPGFAVFDIGAAWTVKPGLILDLRVDNVGDREYALASGSAGDYRMPDRAFFLGFTWQRESRRQP